MLNFNIVQDLNDKINFIGNNLLDTLSRQAENAVYHSSDDNISANHKIHELRRGFKRLRSLLRLLYGFKDNAKKVATDIRNYGKILSPLRESAVNCELFERLISADLLPETKIQQAKAQLAERNRMLLEENFSDNNFHITIHNYFLGFDSHMDHNGIAVPDRFQIYFQVVKSYKKSYNLCHALPAEPHPEELHELRKKLKRLWYQLVFIRFLHPRYFRVKTYLLNKFTDLLGDDHDMHILIEEMMAEKYGFNDKEINIMKVWIEKQRLENLLKLQSRLKQFFSTTPEEFNLTLERFFRLNTR